MSVIELLWHLNVTDTTKYMIFFSLIICILVMCVINGKKKNINKKKKKKNKYNGNNYNLNNQEEEYADYFMNQNPTKCQSNYMKCMEGNVMNGTNEFCYPCLNNGNSPDFFYNPQINEWVKMD